MLPVHETDVIPLLGMRKSYATDLSDAEWTYLRDHLPELPKKVKTRTHSLRDIFDAIFYVPPWQTVFYHFRRFGA